MKARISNTGKGAPFPAPVRRVFFSFRMKEAGIVNESGKRTQDLS